MIKKLVMNKWILNKISNVIFNIGLIKIFN